MRPINAVLVHHDALLAQSLQQSLKEQFRKLAVVSTAQESRDAIARLRATFAIVDLELVNGAELKRLCAEFPGTAFVGIHRLADEIMWSEALQMGAVDCCHPADVRGLLTACDRYVLQAGAAVA